MSRIVFHLLLCCVMTASMYHLGYVCQQDDFWPLLGTYAIFFGAYALAIKTVRHHKLIQGYIALGIGLRLLLLFSVPNLSDDVYRYLWDGHLWLNGINPFVHPPSYYLQHPPLPVGLTTDLYAKLNSPDYHTIYPPVAQGLFSFSCALFPKNSYGSIVVMKAMVFLAELGSLRLLGLLLKQKGLPAAHILLYALNPLIILELTGNLHLEALMIFFLLLSLWLLSKSSYSWATLAIAGSVASKLLPLMFLPFFIRRWGWPKWSVQYFMLMGLALLLMFVPMLSLEFLRGFGSSLDLYFQRFEFNAGIYYLLRWVFMVLTGYNFILFLGPALGLFAGYAIIKMAKSEGDLSWEKLPFMMVLAFGVYLFSATIIHPWYLALPVAICVLTPLRFPILWSGLVVLSYSHYNGGYFRENYWLIALEYIVLAGYLWIEFGVKKRGRSSLGRPIIHEKTT